MSALTVAHLAYNPLSQCAFNASLANPVAQSALRSATSTVANATFLGAAYGYASTGLGYAFTGLSIFSNLSLAYTVSNAFYKSGPVQRTFKNYCPSLVHDPYKAHKKGTPREWFIGGFQIEKDDLPHLAQFPCHDELHQFREAFYAENKNRSLNDICSLGMSSGNEPSMLTDQAILQLMPKSTENIEFMDPLFYRLWTLHRANVAAGKDETLEYHLQRGSSSPEILTLGRICSLMRTSLFNKDMIIIPCLECHDMGIDVEGFDIREKNSLVHGLAILEPKKMKLTLVSPDLALSDTQELFESRKEEWGKCASGFFSYLARNLKLDAYSNPDKWKVEFGYSTKLEKVANSSVLALDCMHQIAEDGALDLKGVAYDDVVKYRRFEYAKKMALGEEIPLVNAYTTQVEKPDDARDDRKTADAESIASRVKRHHQQNNA